MNKFKYLWYGTDTKMQMSQQKQLMGNHLVKQAETIINTNDDNQLHNKNLYLFCSCSVYARLFLIWLIFEIMVVKLCYLLRIRIIFNYQMYYACST